MTLATMQVNMKRWKSSGSIYFVFAQYRYWRMVSGDVMVQGHIGGYIHIHIVFTSTNRAVQVQVQKPISGAYIH